MDVLSHLLGLFTQALAEADTAVAAELMLEELRAFKLSLTKAQPWFSTQAQKEKSNGHMRCMRCNDIKGTRHNLHSDGV